MSLSDLSLQGDGDDDDDDDDDGPAKELDGAFASQSLHELKKTKLWTTRLRRGHRPLGAFTSGANWIAEFNRFGAKTAEQRTEALL